MYCWVLVVLRVRCVVFVLVCCFLVYALWFGVSGLVMLAPMVWVWFWVFWYLSFLVWLFDLYVIWMLLLLFDWLVCLRWVAWGLSLGFRLANAHCLVCLEFVAWGLCFFSWVVF